MPERATFSVIVPTRDRRESLDRCLTSLARMEYPRGDYEVIVVDDGGSVSPREVVDRHGQSMNVTLASVSHAGPASARNAGIEKSRFEFLAFTDDDCTADPAWLECLARRLLESRGSVVGGKVLNGLRENRYARASQGLQDFLYQWYHEERRGGLPFFTTNNLAVARRDMDEIGGFDSSFPFASEDRDWCDRAMLAGRDLVYASGAVVHHWHGMNLRTFLAQHFRYGQGAVRFHETRAGRRGVRVRLESLGFYTGMLASPFAAGSPAPAIDALLLMASQSASFAGFASEMARRRAGTA